MSGYCCHIKVLLAFIKCLFCSCHLTKGSNVSNSCSVDSHDFCRQILCILLTNIIPYFVFLSKWILRTLLSNSSVIIQSCVWGDMKYLTFWGPSLCFSINASLLRYTEVTCLLRRGIKGLLFNFMFAFKIYIRWWVGAIIPERIHMFIVGERSLEIFGEIPVAFNI